MSADPAATGSTLAFRPASTWGKPKHGYTRSTEWNCLTGVLFKTVHRTRPHTTVAAATWDAKRLIIASLNARTTALVSTGANETDRTHLISHLGRKTLQWAITREFKTASRKDKHGNTVTKL